MTVTRLTSFALVAALAAAPALAQNAGTSPSTTAPGAGATSPAVGTPTPGSDSNAPATTTRHPATATTAPDTDPKAPATAATTPATAPPAAGMNAPAAGTTPPGATAASAPTPNPVLTQDGLIRTSKVIGASVYNENGDDLGTVNDILMGKDQKAAQVVLSVGAVLGIGGKYVAVPYEKLQFPDQLTGKESRVMMPGTTEKEVSGIPEFHYASK